MQAVEIDRELVERWILELAQYGACAGTGVCRAVYTPEWSDAQNQIRRWIEEAGLEASSDAVGNVWGKLEGSEPGPSIVTGSHIDSQIYGGRYDGALGVIAGLVALRALRAQFGQPKRTLEVVSFCEEEGSRFPSAYCWGSRAINGLIRPGEADQHLAEDGTTMGDAMRDVQLDPDQIPSVRRTDIDTFVELHIEQGPFLEEAGLPVAIVHSITGIHEYLIEVTGRADHAGARPMDLRRDAMAGAAEMITCILENARRAGRPAVSTVGKLQVQPGYPAIVPQTVTFSLDARHPDGEALERLTAAHRACASEIAERYELDVRWGVTGELAPCQSDPGLVKLFEDVAREANIPTLSMASGAFHDTQIMANSSKVAMIFVQSKDGRSHAPEEFTSIEHAVAGIQVLANGLKELAYEN